MSTPRGEVLRKMLQDRARFGADSPVPLCRAIVEHLGLTREMVDALEHYSEFRSDGEAKAEIDAARAAARALATLLEAAGVKP